MKPFNFNRIKHESEPLVDCFLLSEMKNNLLNHKPFRTKAHEIYFFTKGSGEFKLDHHTISFQEGTLIFLAPNRWRHWKELFDVTDAYVIIFKEELINDYFHDQLFLYRFNYFYNESSPSFLHTKPSERDEIQNIFFKIKTELNHTGADSKHFLRSLLYYLLISLNRKYKRDFNVEAALLNNTQVSIFKKLLENRIRTFQQVSDFTDEMGISKTQLNKVAKEAFGKSVSSIIKARRIAEAKRLILFTNLDIAEISNMLNYSEPSNFNRIFKNHTTYTPSKYRQMYSN